MRRIRPVLLGVGLLAACGEEGPPFEPTLEAITENLFVPAGCATCHAGPGTNPGLSLLPGADLELVGAEARSPAWKGTPWAGWKLVEPGDPDRSLLVTVLEQPAGLPEDLRMPSGSKVAPAAVEVVRRWIAEGAAR